MSRSAAPPPHPPTSCVSPPHPPDMARWAFRRIFCGNVVSAGASRRTLPTGPFIGR